MTHALWITASACTSVSLPYVAALHDRYPLGNRIACLHKSSDFIALVSIVINKVMDIEEQYSGWNHLEHTLLILPE
jgi:hypothetical protein